MNLVTRLFYSSLGKKFLMAGTGLVLVFFVLGHLLGNLQVFLGPESINAYGHFLKSTPELVWSARLGLLVTVVIHVVSAIRLAAENKAARPVGYSPSYRPIAASYASRTMVMSGLIIGTFVIYHLLHFTAQVSAVNLTGKDFSTLTDAQGRHDIYRMMILGFRQPVVAVFYMVAMGLLCLHLSHGIGALFQSLGLRNKAWGRVLDWGGRWVAGAIFLGYVSIPLAVLFGLGKGVQ